ncbi:MAG: hypothetical protein GPJ29_23540 [Microcystis aeruginosa BK11-02]|nr:hypothetical protein [Microcystis aeruginosa BK11-02]
MNPPPPRKLLDVVRETVRLKHYSYRTEQTYVDWIKRYRKFGLKPRPFRTALSYNGKSDNQAKN